MLVVIEREIMFSDAQKILKISDIIIQRMIGDNNSQNFIIILFSICFLLNFFPFSAASFKCRRDCLQPGCHLLLLVNSRRIRNIAVVINNAVIQLFQ